MSFASPLEGTNGARTTGVGAVGGGPPQGTCQAPARSLRRIAPAVLASAVLATGCRPPPAAAPSPVQTTPHALFAGPEMDYQPGVLRASDGRILLVAERLDPRTLSGDLLLAVSRDGGAGWTAPVPVVASAASERHPALVQHPDGSFSLFHMAGSSADGYRIHRATSPGGAAWQSRGAIELGWELPGEVNPSVLVEPDGTLTMTYHRLRGAAYLARSADGGATWDRRRTAVSDTGHAALPRIARRGDGLYLVTYQHPRQGTELDLVAKTTRDPYDWSGPAVGVSTGGNSHDARPLALADGTFFVPFVDARGGGTFDLFYRTTRDGQVWSPAVRLTDDADRMDVEPYPVAHAQPGRVLLFWGRQAAPDAPRDYDLWLHPGLEVRTGAP